MLHQLYYGRRLVAETASSGERILVAQISSERWQNHLTILAVDGDDTGVDHGGDLPPRPYNVSKLTIDASNYPSDTQQIEIYRGSTPGGAVDTSEPWMIIPFEGAKTYTIHTPPLPGSGVWSLEIVGRDDRDGGGNLGTAKTASITVDAHPPDFDEAFSVSVASGAGTITVTIPED